MSQLSQLFPPLSKSVIYASRCGAKLDSNVLTGGGTDDTAILQAALDTLHTLGGGIFVIDGQALVSDALFNKNTHYPALQVYSNTQIIFPPGCGLFLKANSNIPILAAGLGYAVKNVRISGGILNCNDENQTKEDGALVGDTSNYRWWPYGVAFYNFDNVILEDLEIRNATTFSIVFSAGLISTGTNFIIHNCRSYWDHELTGSSNKDGIHLWGTLSNGLIDGYYSNGDDDSIAFNTDEGVAGFVNLFGMFRFGPSAGGDLTNIAARNVWVDGNTGQHTYRFTFYGVGTGACDQIHLENWRGGVPMDGSIGVGGFSVESLGTITIDKWLIPSSGIEIDSADNLGMSNILPGTDTSAVSGTNQFGEFFKTSGGDFANTNLSTLPTSDPGSGKPWLNHGVLQVGA